MKETITTTSLWKTHCYLSLILLKGFIVISTDQHFRPKLQLLRLERHNNSSPNVNISKTTKKWKKKSTNLISPFSLMDLEGSDHQEESEVVSVHANPNHAGVKLPDENVITGWICQISAYFHWQRSLPWSQPCFHGNPEWTNQALALERAFCVGGWAKGCTAGCNLPPRCLTPWKPPQWIFRFIF